MEFPWDVNIYKKFKFIMVSFLFFYFFIFLYIVRHINYCKRKEFNFFTLLFTVQGSRLEWTWTSVTVTALFLELWADSCSFGFGFYPVLNGLGTEVFGANVIGNWLSCGHTLTVLSRVFTNMLPSIVHISRINFCFFSCLAL